MSDELGHESPEFDAALGRFVNLLVAAGIKKMACAHMFEASTPALRRYIRAAVYCRRRSYVIPARQCLAEFRAAVRQIVPGYAPNGFRSNWTIDALLTAFETAADVPIETDPATVPTESGLPCPAVAPSPISA